MSRLADMVLIKSKERVETIDVGKISSSAFRSSWGVEHPHVCGTQPLGLIYRTDSVEIMHEPSLAADTPISCRADYADGRAEIYLRTHYQIASQP